jgi:hypothetical protein
LRPALDVDRAVVDHVLREDGLRLELVHSDHHLAELGSGGRYFRICWEGKKNAAKNAEGRPFYPPERLKFLKALMLALWPRVVLSNGLRNGDFAQASDLLSNNIAWRSSGPRVL